MIRKKPIHQTATKPQQPSTARPASKAQRDIDDDEVDEDVELDEDEDIDEDENEDEDEEVNSKSKAKSGSKPTPPTKKKSKSVVEDDDDEDQEDDIDDEMAEAFNAVPASSNADGIPTGRYEAVVTEVVWQAWSETKGKSIRMKFELVDPEYEKQNVVTRWFKIFDKDKQTMDVGISIFRQSMAKLGYEFNDIRKLNKLFKEVMADRPGVVLSISYRDWQGTKFIDPKIDGPCDSELVQEYKDNIPY